ncbi:MAG: small metal-binding protein SmbP [Nitrospira sp.]|nr:small metal-binding protein SmbP [Nitrospira sp.]
MTITIRRSALMLAAVGAIVGMPMLNGMALAGNKHVDEAVEHARGAASHGKEGHADACVQHAEEALKHAQGAGVKGPHVDEGVKHLKEAVKHGKAGHADACTEHAEGAATHLSEAK